VLSSDISPDLKKIAEVIDDLRVAWINHIYPDHKALGLKALKEVVDEIAATQPVNIARVFKETSGFYPSNDM
tara:strand:+ start:265 stop:480 length:216 start_codon:yes stop_codon:yes gene_type:complete